MTPEDWEHFFIEAGISTDSAKTHTTKFAEEKLTIDSLQILDRSMLLELGVILMGEALGILKQAKEATTQATWVLVLAAKSPPFQSWDDPATIQEVPNWLGCLY